MAVVALPSISDFKEAQFISFWWTSWDHVHVPWSMARDWSIFELVWIVPHIWYFPIWNILLELQKMYLTDYTSNSRISDVLFNADQKLVSRRNPLNAIKCWEQLLCKTSSFPQKSIQQNQNWIQIMSLIWERRECVRLVDQQSHWHIWLSNCLSITCLITFEYWKMGDLCKKILISKRWIL